MAVLDPVCVFCGSSTGRREAYADGARAMGGLLARQGIGIVYGGSALGMMGALADAALEAGGRVTGILPQGLMEREIGHPGLTELRVVQSMHERKALMAELSRAFIALPGGIGTLEELFEIWTWAQLGIHNRPLGLLNTGGYFDGLLHFLDTAVVEGFVRPAHRALVLVDASAERLLQRMTAWKPPASEPKWITPSQT